MKPAAASTTEVICARLAKVWKVQPIVHVACEGGSDEHVQIWHPRDRAKVGSFPCVIVWHDGTSELHPDAPRKTAQRAYDTSL